MLCNEHDFNFNINFCLIYYINFYFNNNFNLHDFIFCFHFLFLFSFIPFRTLYFITNKKSNSQSRESYSAVISIALEIHRLAPISVICSLHVSFLSPEMSTGRMTPFGGGFLGPECRPDPCGGIVELFETVLTLDEVSNLSIIE